MTRDGWLGSADGTRLYWQAWEPAEPARDAVVLVHGAAEHGGRYAHVAGRLVDAGYAVYALDHRGHGRSDGTRALIDRLDRLVADLALFVARVRAEREGRRPFMVGHSLGGAVALTYAIRHGDTLRGLVLSGPAVATEAVPAALKLTALALSEVAPRLPVFKIEDDAVSRDPEVVLAYQRDPLNHAGKLPARTLGEMLRAMDAIPRDVIALRTPLLLLHGGEDRLCPPAGSEMVHAGAGSADKTLKVYAGLYHEIFNEPEREQVLDDLVEWIGGAGAMTRVAAHGRLEGDRTVVLALAGTDVERDVVDTFAGDRAVAHDAAQAVSLAAASGGEIAPVGVAWLPPQRADGRRFALRDLRGLSDPSRPRARAQARLLERTPERCRVVVGEPAAVDDLRARWERHSGEAGDGDGFTSFVARQARLAVDRAERGLLGARYKTAHDIVEDLLASRGFRSGAEALAARDGRDAEAVIDEARTYLTELASVQNRFARDVWAQGSKFLWGRAYRLDVDRAGLERLRELNARYPLVFLPSHKSNLDGFVMSSVTYEHGFPANHIVGGINMGFWPLGALGRRVGVVWIRRSFGGNDVYKFALRRYLAHLASKRFNLEWYIEGGRSRTGKLLPPRMGLLNYLAKGVEEAGVEEVMLVPVSVVYDRLNEVVEMTAQARGAKKRPEGFGWLVRYARSQRGDLGAVHVRFGEPVALRAGLADGDPHGLSKVAFEVCTRINRATPITPISLVTLALLGADGRAVTVAEAQALVDPVRRYVRLRALPVTEELVNTQRVLDTLVEHGVVETYAAGAEPVYRIRADRDLAAAFYRNVVIHWFVNRAIAELSLVGSADLESALQEAFRLRDLLKFEFFFADKREFRDELQAEAALIDPDWRTQDLNAALEASGGRFADRVLRSFLEAYAVVADRLAARGDAAVDDAELVGECVAVGRQYHLQGRIASAEAVSSELFKTGLKLAANRGLITGGDGVAARRAAFRDELTDVLRRLEVLAP